LDDTPLDLPRIYYTFHATLSIDFPSNFLA